MSAELIAEFEEPILRLAFYRQRATNAMTNGIPATPTAMGPAKATMIVAHRISVADHLPQETLETGAVVSHPDCAERAGAFRGRKR